MYLLYEPDESLNSLGYLARFPGPSLFLEKPMVINICNFEEVINDID